MVGEVVTAGLLDKVLEYLQGLVWVGWCLGIGTAAVAVVLALVFGVGIGWGVRRRD